MRWPKNREDLYSMMQAEITAAYERGYKDAQNKRTPQEKTLQEIRLEALKAQTEFLSKAGQILESHTRAMCSEAKQL